MKDVRFFTPPAEVVVALVAAVSFFWAPNVVVAQAEPAANPLDRSYQQTVRPLLRRYCFECHADDVAEAEIDLAAFQALEDVRRQTKVWLKVGRMLDSRQMPPKEAQQPTDKERTRLQAWVREFLTRQVRARAGDPGPIVLRRLNNAEYTYTLRDLTGVDVLDPAREFPVDGAAGEGFTNVGSGQGMSPALIQKYLDAAKSVADHAVLLPSGIRFSAHTTRRDQTNDLLADIQAFYRQFTADGGGAAVNLQGIKFNTNQGGLLPLEKYLAATLAEREALNSGRATLEDVARQRSLNVRYLTTLWNSLAGDSLDEPSLLIDAVREKWRRATPEHAAQLAADIATVQKTLWKFNSVGHIGRQGGPTCWMEPVWPIATSQKLRFPLPQAPTGSDVVIYLAASDLGDGNQHDYVVWQRPRIEFKAADAGPSLPPVLLRDIRRLTQQVQQAIAAESARAAQYLDAVVELQSSSKPSDQVARTRGLQPSLLSRWTDLLGLGQRAERKITGRFKNKVAKVAGYDAINGWGRHETPILLTNRSDQPISFLTLTVPARGVTLHPSPSQEAVVAWRTPINGQLRIDGLVADTDDKCGNGAAWRIELRTEAGASIVAQGNLDNGRRQRFQSERAFEVKAGDIVSLIVNARDNNHGCDTTHIELRVAEVGGEKRLWDLARDVVDRVHDGNPLPDSYGNRDVWHFCASAGKRQRQQRRRTIPDDSALARWRLAVLRSKPPAEIAKLAAAVQHALTADNVNSLNDPDQELRRQLLDWNGPLRWLAVAVGAAGKAEQTNEPKGRRSSPYGLEPSLFGRHPNGSRLDAADLCLQAPRVLEVRLPAQLAAGAELATTGRLHGETGREGSVQFQVLADKPESPAPAPGLPIVVNQDSQARRRVAAGLKQFRELFPPALCYARIVPVDEVVTLNLFYREDDHLKRLMLDEQQAAQLDRLWEELSFVSREPLKLVVSFEQISEFATQDRPDLVKAFAPLREVVNKRADAFRQRMLDAEPLHVQALLELADRAWRRPLTDAEQQGLRGLHQRLRSEGISHEDAVRLTLARVLTSPAFLYKLEQPAPGKKPAQVGDYELAARLSYFLWSSLPDAELRTAAKDRTLTNTDVLLAQARRMLQDARARRLAIQFACQWLHLRDFDKNDDKNEKLYPEFAELRSDMYQETVRFFEDMFRNNGSILAIVDADHTFLNQTLARHYGIEGVSGEHWRRVEGVRGKGRGGVLGMAAFLASQSGASRTSPILRGNWIYETLLGERLPRPPANVPQLPDQVPAGLTARQLIQRHSSAAACAKCHARIDPYGFALEQYDAIGRLRPQKVDTQTTLADGATIQGVDGLRGYLANQRRDDIVRQFCRKLLGYALGRELQLSDQPLLEEMQTKLKAGGFRFQDAVEMIVASPQFRTIRGQQTAEN